MIYYNDFIIENKWFVNFASTDGVFKEHSLPWQLV